MADSNAEVLVVGAGPAGIAASCAASDSGRKVLLLDDNPAVGGQIWRGGERKPPDKQAKAWFERLAKTNVQRLFGARVVASPAPKTLIAETPNGPTTFAFDRLILATGAREVFLPFPGWTLPGVMGAGGLQAMAKSRMPIAGKTIVVAGSGPLLLAVASYLRLKGAVVPIIAEQTTLWKLAAFAAGLAAHPAKIGQAIRLKASLVGTPLKTNCWPVRVESTGERLKVSLSRGKPIVCDYLACGFGLLPNTELPALLGCEVAGGRVVVDDFQRTNVADVFVCGEPTGVGGTDLALEEGLIAGYAVCDDEESASRRFPARRRAQAFARRLDAAFALRPELRSLATDDTLVCRCEDVRLGQLKQHPDWRSAKLQTRCGMGPCQGRICGPATEFLLHWNVESIRPPVFPATLQALSMDGSAST